MAATPAMPSGASEYSEGLDQYATHWELSSLRMRSATLSAENEALRSHVSQLQEQVALLCEDLQPDGGIVNEAAAARPARLERELHQKLAELEETSNQAQALSSENAALRGELERSQERLHAVEQDSSATQARLQTLQQLYLKSSRTLPGPEDLQATHEHDLAAAIEPQMAAQSPVGSPADEPMLPPRDIVPALNEIAALQKERNGFKSQVKKLEDRCGQLSRDKEELCQALTALKKGQTIAAGPGQTRTVNLMRRVHTLAEQLKQKDAALAEKTAYIGKLEWRLLCQHKALEEKRGKAVPTAGKPPARKPQLTGRLASQRLAIKHAPEAPAQRSAKPIVGAYAHARAPDSRFVTPRAQLAASTACPRNTAMTSKGADRPQEAPKQGASENDWPGREDEAAEGHDWQADPKQASRSLSGAFAESAQGRASRVAPSPLYVSRSQQQSRSASQDGAVSQRGPMIPPSLTASPAMSELVYSLPVTPQSHFSLADAGLPSARATPAPGAAESAGSAAGPRGQQRSAPEGDLSTGAGMQPAPALTTPFVGVRSSPAADVADSSASAGFSSSAGPGVMAYTLSAGSQEPAQDAAVPADSEEQSAAAHSGSQPMCTYEGQSAEGSRRHTDSSYRSCDDPRGTDDELPVSYSGFSSDMRAAANATADSLFRQAEASSADSSQQRRENGTNIAQQADIPVPYASYSSGGLSGAASMQEPMGSEGVPEELSVEELERHIRALQLEIARSDAAGAGGRLRRDTSAEHTGDDEGIPFQASTPLPEDGSLSEADEKLELEASYSMRWKLLPERRQH